MSSSSNKKPILQMSLVNAVKWENNIKKQITDIKHIAKSDKTLRQYALYVLGFPKEPNAISESIINKAVENAKQRKVNDADAHLQIEAAGVILREIIQKKNNSSEDQDNTQRWRSYSSTESLVQDQLNTERRALLDKQAELLDEEIRLGGELLPLLEISSEEKVYNDFLNSLSSHVTLQEFNKILKNMDDQTKAEQIERSFKISETKTAERKQLADQYEKDVAALKEKVTEIKYKLHQMKLWKAGQTGTMQVPQDGGYIKTSKGKRKVHIGKRGGKYIMMGGKKKYLK